MLPDLKFYHGDGATLVSLASPIAFGSVDPGITSDIITIELWNDKGGILGSDPAVAPRLYAIGGPDNVDPLFAGTPYNGHKSMLEGRSCDAAGTSGDRQTDWTPLGPNQLLTMGDIPADAMRTIELRLQVPVDAVALPASGWQLRSAF